MMMMGGMGAGFSLLLLLYAILALGLILGFSYIIWILALKEAGYVKTTGLVIGCGIAALAVILFLSGLIYGGRMAGGYGMGSMMGPGMMMEGKEGQKMMLEMMMKDPEMKKMMREMEKRGR